MFLWLQDPKAHWLAVFSLAPSRRLKKRGWSKALESMCALLNKSKPEAKKRTNETGTETELVTRSFTRPKRRRDLKA